MLEMNNEQFSALTDLLNFCCKAERTRRLVVKDWQQLRDRMNKVFLTPGPPRKKISNGLISDINRGVPLTVVAKKNGVSRGTVYRMIREHPELSKLWEEKGNKKPLILEVGSVTDSTSVQSITPPLSNGQIDETQLESMEPNAPTRSDRNPQAVLDEFLATHKPTVATSNLPLVVKRRAIIVAMVDSGIGGPEDLKQLDEAALAALIGEFEQRGQVDEPKV